MIPFVGRFCRGIARISALVFNGYIGGTDRINEERGREMKYYVAMNESGFNCSEYSKGWTVCAFDLKEKADKWASEQNSKNVRFVAARVSKKLAIRIFQRSVDCQDDSEDGIVIDPLVGPDTAIGCLCYESSASCLQKSMISL